MEKRKVGFDGEKYSETSLEDFFGKWILISLRGNGNYSGKLVEINEDKIGLLPYQKVTHDNKGMPIHKITEEGLPYPIQEWTL